MLLIAHPVLLLLAIFILLLSTARLRLLAALLLTSTPISGLDDTSALNRKSVKGEAWMLKRFRVLRLHRRKHRQWYSEELGEELDKLDGVLF